ncbi:hypothetical protein FHR32_004612 [Streptosporangium album]|uniref:Uncharacterized protein n=1 Tax=Streptosporangium album TaxID=47479 RepID=A0A7W7RYB1_9ACTN|nr:hypothetical protein [Streptosporangium album]MBB4940307.1 hypothetical protein [Streptosporangium album]
MLTTVAGRRTGLSTDPTVLTHGYALSLGISGILLAIAVAVALTVLPKGRPGPQTGTGARPEELAAPATSR